MIIEGEKIFLKPITKQDTDDIIRWRNSDFVRCEFIYRNELTRADHEKWLKDKVDTKEVIQFVIYEKKSDRKIGSVYFRDIDRKHKKCEYGIFIGEEDALGKGYGSEVAKLSCDYIFNNTDINRIYLRLLSSNARAKKSYINAGFIEEGVAREDVYLDGEFIDVIFMSRIREKKENRC